MATLKSHRTWMVGGGGGEGPQGLVFRKPLKQFSGIVLVEASATPFSACTLKPRSTLAKNVYMPSFPHSHTVVRLFAAVHKLQPSANNYLKPSVMPGLIS